MELINLPTGKLIINEYSNGRLETLSIGDYGKSKNIKANFLGYTRELNGVPNGDILPLQEKWVITVSTQYGCTMDCTFCDVPSIPYRGNATFNDMRNQIIIAMSVYPDVKYTDRLNIHFARMGEPAHNFRSVIDIAEDLIINKNLLQDDTGVRIETIHPVFTTSCPANIGGQHPSFERQLAEWAFLKNDLYNGQAGLQLSINSTAILQRHNMFRGKSLSIFEIADAVKNLPEPLGRKYTLNFAYCSEYEIDGKFLAEHFNPEHWMVKITPIHNNIACVENNIITLDGYNSYDAYRDVEQSCLDAGFDVLVFIPSMDEDNNCITCGNAILAGSKIKG